MNLKRKGQDDSLHALLPSLPSKKLRQDSDVFFQDIQQDGPVSIPEVCPVEIPSDTPVDSTPVSLFVTEPDADERALVLYRPMNLPDQSKLRLRPVEGAFPKNYRDFHVSEAVDLFSPTTKSFKHDYALATGKGVADNSLAVIPYVDHAAATTSIYADDAYGGRVIIEDVTDQVDDELDEELGVEEQKGEDDPGMAVEEAMPMDEDMMDVTPEVPQQFVVQQPCEFPPWQRFDPNFSQAMWSR